MVLKYLNDDEILKVAVNLEQDGVEFYKKCVSLSKVEKAKSMFLFLAGEEEKHFAYFKKLDQHIEYMKFRPGEIDEEISMYLRSLIDTGVFSNKFTDHDWENFTDKMAVEFGINIEKYSILFYSGVLKITENEDSVRALTKIIEEEKRHLVALTIHWKEL